MRVLPNHIFIPIVYNAISGFNLIPINSGADNNFFELQSQPKGMSQYISAPIVIHFSGVSHSVSDQNMVLNG